MSNCTFKTIPLILLLAFAGCVSGIKAQEKNNQIGLNITGFVKQYLVFNTQPTINDNPYLITYRRYGKIVNLRAGFAGNSSYTREDQLGSSQFVYTDNRTFNMRVGADRIHNLTKKWNLYYGLDLFGATHKIKQHTKPKFPGPFVSESKYYNYTKTIGVSPNLTVEFRINQKISVFTETNLTFSWSHSSERSENPGFPNSSQSGWSNFGSTTINLPLSVFCAFRF